MPRTVTRGALARVREQVHRIADADVQRRRLALLEQDPAAVEAAQVGVLRRSSTRTCRRRRTSSGRRRRGRSPCRRGGRCGARRPASSARRDLHAGNALERGHDARRERAAALLVARRHDQVALERLVERARERRLEARRRARRRRRRGRRRSSAPRRCARCAPALRIALSRASAPLARQASGRADDARQQRHREARGHRDGEEHEHGAAGHADQPLAGRARARDAVGDQRGAGEREEGGEDGREAREAPARQRRALAQARPSAGSSSRARRGSSAEKSVTPKPTTSPSTTPVVASCGEVEGRPKPTASKSALMPARSGAPGRCR